MLFLQEKTEGFLLKIHVLPRSSKNSITGLHKDALKIKLTAPPVDNAANKMCLKFLAKCLNLPKTSLSIIKGKSSRTKQVLIKFNNNSISSISVAQKQKLREKIAALENFAKNC